MWSVVCSVLLGIVRGLLVCVGVLFLVVCSYLWYAVCYLLCRVWFAVRCLLSALFFFFCFVVGCLLFVVCWLSSAVRCWLFDVCC